jgi:hypothetical protein
MMEAVYSSEMLEPTYKAILRYNSEEHNMNLHRLGNLEFEILTSSRLSVYLFVFPEFNSPLSGRGSRAAVCSVTDCFSMMTRTREVMQLTYLGHLSLSMRNKSAVVS